MRVLVRVTVNTLPPGAYFRPTQFCDSALETSS